MKKIIDEASMVGQKMMVDIKENILDMGAKIIFIGDTFQLPPVQDTPIFDTFNFQLENVQRQGLDSPILSVATSTRMTGGLVVPNSNSSDGNFLLTKNAAQDYLNEIRNPNVEKNIIYVTDTNKERTSVNIAARNLRYGDASKLLQKNDKIIYIANTEEHRNGETATVNSSKDTAVKFIKYINAIYLKDVYENKKKVGVKEIPIKLEQYIDAKGDIFMLAPGFMEAGLQQQTIVAPDFEQWAHDRMKPKQTSKGSFYTLNKKIGVATHGYAITAHKSQGSEWDKVYVNQT